MKVLEARTERPENDKFVIDDDDMDSNTATESDFSLKSRSFLRKILDHSSHRRTFYELGYVYVDIGSICIHGKELLRSFTFHQKTGKDLTMKQMSDISLKLIIGQSDEIYGVTPINWEDSSWKQFLWSVMKKSTVSCTQVYVFSDSVLCFFSGILTQMHPLLHPQMKHLSFLASSFSLRL